MLEIKYKKIEMRQWILLIHKTQFDQVVLEQKGPFTTREVTEKLRIGNIKYTDYIWKKGYIDWVRLFDISEFNEPSKPRYSQPFTSPNRISNVISDPPPIKISTKALPIEKLKEINWQLPKISFSIPLLNFKFKKMIYYSIISIGIFILGTKLYPSIKLKFAPKNLLTKNQNEFKFNYSEDTDKLNVVGPLEVGENILISFEGRMGHILSSQSVWLQTQGIISTDHLFEIDLKSLKLPIGYYKIIIKLKTHFKNLHFFIGKKPSDFDLKLRGIVEGERKNFLAEKDKLFQLSTDMLNQSKMFNFKTREYRKDKAQLKAYVDLWTNKNIKNWKELSLNKESQFFSRQYEEILSIQNQIELILLPYLQQVNYQEQASKKHEQINTDQIEDLLNEIGFISKSFL